MLKPWMGHEWGAKKVEKLFEWCVEYKIKEMTLYALSIDNLNRPKEEFNYLMDLFKKEVRKLLKDKKLDKAKIKINFIGRLWLLPKELQELMNKLMEKTKKYNNHIINIAMAYGGRAEVIDAVRKIAEKVKNGKLDINKINEETFRENLYLNSEPDLIIRTGGEIRTSDFLNYQSGYSEWIFLTEILWPEFTEEHLINCIKEYSRRQRRFGK